VWGVWEVGVVTSRTPFAPVTMLAPLDESFADKSQGRGVCSPRLNVWILLHIYRGEGDCPGESSKDSACFFP
jgi:hypothetical protein